MLLLLIMPAYNHATSLDNIIPVEVISSNIYHRLQSVNDIAALMQTNRANLKLITRQPSLMQRYTSAKLAYYLDRFAMHAFAEAFIRGEPQSFLRQLVDRMAPMAEQKQALMIHYANRMKYDLVKAMLELGVPIRTLDYAFRQNQLRLLEYQQPTTLSLIGKLLGRGKAIFPSAHQYQMFMLAKQRSDALKQIYREAGENFRRILTSTTKCINCHVELTNAVMNGETERAKALLGQGARPVGDDYKAILEIAASTGNHEMYKLLLSHGVFYTPTIQEALAVGNAQIFKLMFQFWMLNIRLHGQILARFALLTDSLDHFQVLLEEGLTAEGDGY